MDLKTTGIALLEAALSTSTSFPGRVFSSRASALCVSDPSFCLAYSNTVLHINLNHYILVNSVEYSKIFRFSAHQTGSQNTSFIVSGFPLSQFTPNHYRIKLNKSTIEFKI